MCRTHDEHFHSLTSINRTLILFIVDEFLDNFRGVYFFYNNVDHIPSIAKTSCYLTCIKHAFKHPQTRIHLYRESCRQTDTQTDRHTHLCIEPYRQTDTHPHTFAENHADRHTHTFAENRADRHTHARTHICREPCRQTHTHTHTNAENHAARQTNIHAHK